MSIKAIIKFSYVLSAALLSANILTWALQAIAALSSKQVNNIAKQITVRIDGTDKGSGVIVKQEGKVYTVLTNAHVLRKKGKYTVQTQDDKIHDINYQNVKFLPNNIDLATFQFSSDKTYTIAKLSNSDDVFWGDRIYVTGYPVPDKQIAKPTLTFLAGGISYILDDPYPSGYALVYNNPVKKGMSGGPVLNEDGEVVGINGMSHQDNRTKAVTFMGIPINTCIKLAPNSCSLVSSSITPTPTPVSTPTPTPILTPTPTSSFNFSVAYTLSAGNDFYIQPIAISPSGLTLISGSSGNTFKEWNLANGGLLRTFLKHTIYVTAIAISPSGETVATGTLGGDINIWNLATGTLITTLKGDFGGVSSLNWTPDEKTLVSSHWDLTTRIWDVNSRKLTKTIKVEHSQTLSGFYPAAINSKRKIIVTTSPDKTVKIWHLETGDLLRTLPGHSIELSRVTITPDGLYVVTHGIDEVADKNTRIDVNIKIWSAETGKLINTMGGLYSRLYSFAFSPDEKTMVTGGTRIIYVWDRQTWKLLATWRGEAEDINSMAFTPDGKTLVTGSRDGTIRVWRTSR
jgi:WD40 repeat protein